MSEYFEWSSEPEILALAFQGMLNAAVLDAMISSKRDQIAVQHDDAVSDEDVTSALREQVLADNALEIDTWLRQRLVDGGCPASDLDRHAERVWRLCRSTEFGTRAP